MKTATDRLSWALALLLVGAAATGGRAQSQPAADQPSADNQW